MLFFRLPSITRVFVVLARPPALDEFFCAYLPANQILDMFLVEGWPLLFKMSLGVLLEMRPLLEVCVLAHDRSDYLYDISCVHYSDTFV